MSRILMRARLRAAGPDDGLTVIEVIVSLVVLALFASAVSVVLMNAFGTARKNRLRVEASALATRQMEITRNLSVLDVPNGQVYATQSGDYSTTPVTVTSDGVPYTITQDAQYVTSNAATSTCSAPAGTRLAYKRISIVVRWPNMGSVVPPRLDSLMQLPVTGLDNTKGVLSVPVKDANGAAVQGATITVLENGTPAGSAVTGPDGCAVIDGLTPASDYTVQAADTGYVDMTGNPVPSHSAPMVQAALLTADTGFVMDVGGAIQVALVPPTGQAYALPATPLDVTLANTSASPQYSMTFPDCSVGPSGYCSTGSGMTRTVGSPNDTNQAMHGLFPFQTQDSVYINDYGASNAPAVTMSVVGGATSSTTSPTGGVPLGGITVTNSTGAAATLWAYGAAITSDNLLQLSPTTVAKGAKAYYALPYGGWCVAATAANAQLATCPAGQSKTLTSAAKTASITVKK